MSTTKNWHLCSIIFQQPCVRHDFPQPSFYSFNKRTPSPIVSDGCCFRQRLHKMSMPTDHGRKDRWKKTWSGQAGSSHSAFQAECSLLRQPQPTTPSCQVDEFVPCCTAAGWKKLFREGLECCCLPQGDTDMLPLSCEYSYPLTVSNCSVDMHVVYRQANMLYSRSYVVGLWCSSLASWTLSSDLALVEPCLDQGCVVERPCLFGGSSDIPYSTDHGSCLCLFLGLLSRSIDSKHGWIHGSLC